MTSSRWDAIIVGGGAAGLWAAGTAAARGKRVMVLEKNNKAGVKILMSGGTRCNITHACDSRAIAEAFGKKGRVLLSVLGRLSPSEVIDEFQRWGVTTKVEETGKVFPVGDRALDVRDALVARLAGAGACLKTGMAVQYVRPSPTGLGFEVGLPGDALWTKTVLITTGGLSYSGCGTTGDGYGWAHEMGHGIVELRPALTPLLSAESWVHSLSGVTLEDVIVTAASDRDRRKDPDWERFQSRGGFLWTHFGCSGPTAMNVSRCFAAEQRPGGSRLELDLLPEWPREQCEAWLSSTSGALQVSTILGQRTPKRLATTLMALAGIAPEQKAAELSRKARQSLVELLKRLKIPIEGTRGYAKAEVTAGGVDLGEVNFQDMQSRKTPGLYLAGEILDLDGPIGGYNFQAAWSTGHTAGLHL